MMGCIIGTDGHFGRKYFEVVFGMLVFFNLVRDRAPLSRHPLRRVKDFNLYNPLLIGAPFSLMEGPDRVGCDIG